MNAPIHNSAMLVTLNISRWSARMLDRQATKEVDQAHGAKGAGRYNKLLIAKEALEPTERVEGAARAYHYSVTLPWGDDDARILPAALFMDYGQKIGEFKEDFARKVNALVADYPRLREEARLRLGTLYRPEDYPRDGEIARKFAFSTSFRPVPSAADFRVDIQTEYIEQIRAEITAAQTQAQVEATKHVWGRVREAVERISRTCSAEKPRIFDSMMDNLSQLIDVLPALNISNDPALTEVAEEIKVLVTPTERLRNNKYAREVVAGRAEAILNKIVRV